jgi:hypothetical protein
MDITLKNVRIYAGLSQETVAFAASLYADGKKVGETRNAGHGGNNDVDVRNKEGRWDVALLDRMEAEAATHTWSYEGETHNHNLDSYIGQLVDDVLEQRDLKRRCRTQTLFRIPAETYQHSEYHFLKRKYSEVVKEHLVKKYGPGVEILNELARKEVR